MNIISNVHPKEDKIVLMVMPYMAPLCPPMGSSCLKSFLGNRGYNVTAVDVMSDLTIKEAAYKYLEVLKGFIPEFKQSFYFNVGIDALKNHFMAFNNHTDDKKYRELVKVIVYQNYYVHITDEQVEILHNTVAELFTKLESFLREVLEREKPTIVGISVYRGTLASSLFAFRLVKKINPNIKTLMGGAIFSQELIENTPNFDYVMARTPYVDHIFIGEGENLFLSYLEGKLLADKRVYTLKDINEEMINLDSLDLPDFSDFDLSNYPLVPSYTSRGCVYHCSFCTESSFWKRYRKKRVDNIVRDLEISAKKYNRSLFVLTDCLINPVVTDLAKEMVARNLNIYWDVYLKVDKHVCDPEYTRLWRKGGFYRARLGIETGSQKVLDLMDKKITIEQSKAALSSLADAGIKATTYWAVGHPGETEEDFQKTLEFLTEMQDSIYEAEADPFRYFYAGQGRSDSWEKEYGRALVYPEEAAEMLWVQTWTLKTRPSREEIYDRLCRFKDHCRKLNITNLDSVNEIISSDERWKSLHKNAVPSFAELDSNHFVDEHRDVTPLLSTKNTQEEDVDFSF